MSQKKISVAGLGEILWDVFPDGKKLGGAPGNFAFHGQQLGFEANVISAVGIDDNGVEILEKIDDFNLDVKYIERLKEFPTGKVTVKVNDKGIPNYTIHENVAWDNISWNEDLSQLANELDAVCFGSLAQRNKVSHETIARFLNHTKPQCLRVFDINLRQQFYSKEIIHTSLLYANILKLNEDELPVVANIFNYSGSEEEILEHLMTDYQLRIIALTKGSVDSLLIDHTGISYCEVPKVNIVDTVGAGDSFTAVLVAGILNGIDLNIVHKVATNIAAYVCTQNGATPFLPANFLKQLK